MRILGFSKHWEKLALPCFTTFRFPRKDRDWAVGEQVQVVLRPRTPEREVLGIAEIVAKEPRCMARHGAHGMGCPTVTDHEARADGFPDYFAMWEWLFVAYKGGQRFLQEPMHKLTVDWVARWHRKETP